MVQPQYSDLHSIMSVMTGDEKHTPAATSTLDALWVLYSRVLRVSPEKLDEPDRDRFLLSKGHGVVGLYSVLAARGFIPHDWLPGFGTFESPLGHHPDRTLVPGVEIGAGSLGHGLPIAVGCVLGLQAQRLTAPAVWVLVGDGEMEEGSNHEAIALAGVRGLEQLHVVVIDNASATYGWPRGLATRFTSEGWTARTVDGRDHDALHAAFVEPHPGRPLAVVAHAERRDP